MNRFEAPSLAYLALTGGLTLSSCSLGAHHQDSGVPQEASCESINDELDQSRELIDAQSELLDGQKRYMELQGTRIELCDANRDLLDQQLTLQNHLLELSEEEADLASNATDAFELLYSDCEADLRQSRQSLGELVAAVSYLNAGVGQLEGLVNDMQNLYTPCKPDELTVIRSFVDWLDKPKVRKLAKEKCGDNKDCRERIGKQYEWQLDALGRAQFFCPTQSAFGNGDVFTGGVSLSGEPCERAPQLAISQEALHDRGALTEVLLAHSEHWYETCNIPPSPTPAPVPTPKAPQEDREPFRLSPDSSLALVDGESSEQ